jgi:hypothetical protein
MRSGKSLAMSAVTWSETLHGGLLGSLPAAALREFAGDFGIETSTRCHRAGGCAAEGVRRHG